MSEKTFLSHWFANMLAKKGWEEIIGPLGPLMARMVEASPEPQPWQEGVAALVEAARAKDVASRLPPGQTKNAAAKGAAATIEQVFDDYCGTPPRRLPWPWPGPPPWGWAMVSALSETANSFQAGSLRDEIQGIAGQLAARLGGGDASAR